jgi:uncharacterized protein YutE (UPF0331/DUF86 family)
MSPLDVQVIKRKLALIVQNLKALEPIVEMTVPEYCADIYRRKATERLLQELLEAAIDINIHIVAATGNPPPDDYYESFIKAGELRILSSQLAEKLAPSAGLRNRLVHEYNGLDHTMVLRSVKMAEELYPQYIKEINDYIASLRSY